MTFNQVLSTTTQIYNIKVYTGPVKNSSIFVHIEILKMCFERVRKNIKYRFMNLLRNHHCERNKRLKKKTLTKSQDINYSTFNRHFKVMALKIIFLMWFVFGNMEMCDLWVIFNFSDDFDRRQKGWGGGH